MAEKIQGTAQLHYGLARARDLFTDDRAACSAFLSEVREAYPQYTGILTIKPDGRLFCDSLRSGRALADAARKLRPSLRVLYTSGYTENAIVHHGRLDPGVLLLAKPYRLADLARAIRSALAQASG